MGLTLPGELERLLNDLGFTWPEVDEQDLFSVGGDWCSFGSAVGSAHATSSGATQQLLSRNQSDALQTFSTRLFKNVWTTYGLFPGFGSTLRYLPGRNVTVVVLANGDNTTPITADIADLLLQTATEPAGSA